jgi:hypothetical protein
MGAPLLSVGISTDCAPYPSYSSILFVVIELLYELQIFVFRSPAARADRDICRRSL